MKIQKVADKFGVTPRALRFYEHQGLLTPDRSGNHKGRVYDETQQKRIAAICLGKELGLTIRDIREAISDEGVLHIKEGIADRFVRQLKMQAELNMIAAERWRRLLVSAEHGVVTAVPIYP